MLVIDRRHRDDHGRSDHRIVELRHALALHYTGGEVKKQIDYGQDPTGEYTQGEILKDGWVFMGVNHNRKALLRKAEFDEHGKMFTRTRTEYIADLRKKDASAVVQHSDIAVSDAEKNNPVELSREAKEELVASLNGLRVQLDAQYALRDNPAERSKFDPEEIERINRLAEEGAVKLVAPEVLRGQVKTRDKNWHNMTFKERGEKFDASQRAEYFATEKRRDAFKKLLGEAGVEKEMAGVVYRRFMEQASSLERISREINRLIEEGKPCPVVTEASADFRTLLLHGVPADLIKQGNLAAIQAIIASHVDEYISTREPKMEGTAIERLVQSYVNEKEKYLPYQFKTYEQFKDIPEIQSATVDKVHALIASGDTKAMRNLPGWVDALMRGDAAYVEFVAHMPEEPNYHYHYQNEETKKSYLEQLKKLYDEREHAKKLSDTSRASKLQNEIDKLNKWYHAPFIEREDVSGKPEQETVADPSPLPEVAPGAAAPENEADMVSSKAEQDAMLNDATLSNIQRTYLTNRQRLFLSSARQNPKLIKGLLAAALCNSRHTNVSSCWRKEYHYQILSAVPTNQV